MDKEEEIEDVREWKDILAKTWLGSVAGALIIGVFGWFTGDMSLVGMAFGFFMILSIGFIALFSVHDDRQEELEEEVRLEKLEKRIEKLESEVL